MWFKEKGVPRAGGCRRDCATLGTAWPRNPTAAPNTRLLSRRTHTRSLCLHPSLVVSIPLSSSYRLNVHSFLVPRYITVSVRHASSAKTCYLYLATSVSSCLSFFSLSTSLLLLVTRLLLSDIPSPSYPRKCIFQ